MSMNGFDTLIHTRGTTKVEGLFLLDSFDLRKRTHWNNMESDLFEMSKNHFMSSWCPWCADVQMCIQVILLFFCVADFMIFISNYGYSWVGSSSLTFKSETLNFKCNRWEFGLMTYRNRKPVLANIKPNTKTKTKLNAKRGNAQRSLFREKRERTNEINRHADCRYRNKQ